MDKKTTALALTLSLGLLAACGGGDPDCALAEYDGPPEAVHDAPACLRAVADFYECYTPKDGERTRCCAGESWEVGKRCSGPAG